MNYLDDEYKNFEVEKKLGFKYIISKFTGQKHYNNIFYDHKIRKNYFVLSFNFKPQMSKNMILYLKKENFIVLDINQINNKNIKLPYVKYKNFLILEKEPSKIDNRINIFVRYYDDIVPNIISYKFKNKNFNFSELSDCANQINQASLFATKENIINNIAKEKIYIIKENIINNIAKEKIYIINENIESIYNNNKFINIINENLQSIYININAILIVLLIIFILLDKSKILTYLSIFCLINFCLIIFLNYDLQNIYYTLFYCLFIYLFFSLKEIYYKMND